MWLVWAFGLQDFHLLVELHYNFGAGLFLALVCVSLLILSIALNFLRRYIVLRLTCVYAKCVSCVDFDVTSLQYMEEVSQV